MTASQSFPLQTARLLVTFCRTPLLACRFHDLRHTHATELMRAGIHVKVVSERLGHSSVRVTLDRYSHVTVDMQDTAAEATDALLAPLLRLA
jgi:integrase